MRIHISLALLFLATVLLTALAKPGSPQLGNLDDCDVFYRLAKYNVGWDNVPHPVDTALATAYSQLYTACMLRNGQVPR